MWDLATLKRLNEEREKYLREQREQEENKGKVVSLLKGSKKTA
tara:strand:- start:813 stop:941 length:129 start_codon:yes stop_codon:yes gene_type:complete